MKYFFQICVLSAALSGTVNAMEAPGLQNSLTRSFKNISPDQVMLALTAALGGFVLYQIYFNPKPNTGTQNYSSSSNDSSYLSEDTYYHEVQTSYSTPAAPIEKEKEKEKEREETSAQNATFQPFTYDSSDPELEYLAYLNN